MPDSIPLKVRLRVAIRALAELFPTGGVGRQLMAGVVNNKGNPPPRGTKEFLEAYSTMPWLRAVTERVANLCSSVTWRLYVNTAAGGPKGIRPFVRLTEPLGVRLKQVQRAGILERRKSLERLANAGTLREVTDHLMLDCLHGTNAYLTGGAIRKLLHIHLDTVGTALWLKQRNLKGKPDGVWPIPPHWISEAPTPARPFFRVSHNGWQQDIPTSEILWFNDPDPANPYGFGTGLAKALTDEFNTSEAASKHVASFFFNRGRPDLVVSGEGLNDGNTAQLEDAWMSVLRRKAGMYEKPLFLNHEVKVQALGQNFEQMTLVPLLQHERDTIIQVFGIPPEAMGILEHSNRSTIDAATYILALLCAVPRLEAVREVLQERFAPEYDERLIVDYDSPVQEDKEFHLKVLQAFPAAPKVNEIRELGGLEPLPPQHGDIHLVPFSQSAVKELGELTEVEPPPTSLPPGAPVPDTNDEGG